MMQKRILLIRSVLILLAGLLIACAETPKNSNRAQLEKIFQHLYSLETEGIRSLSLEVAGSHETVRNFLMDLNIDSGKIIIYWRAPFEMKTRVYSKTGEMVPLPRWLDFGFAFGIFYGTDLVPIFARPENEIHQIETDFNLVENGVLNTKITDKNQHEYTVKNLDQKVEFVTIVTDSSGFPLNRLGTRLVQTGGQMIELGYSENWIKLPNQKAVTSYRLQMTKDKSQRRREYRISYLKIGDYWLPTEIVERKRATEAGKLQKQDTRLAYLNYGINPTLSDSLFHFAEPTDVRQNFSTPDSTLASLIAAARAGNIPQMQGCFSADMAVQFANLTHEASQGITPFAIIPDQMLQKIKNDVTRWVFGSYVEQIGEITTTRVRETATQVVLTVDYSGRSSLFRGQYQLIQEAGAWKIDTNPYVIFKIQE